MATYNSAFAGLNIREVVENSAPIVDYLRNSMNGVFLEEAVLRNAGTTNSPVIEYFDDAPGFLADDAEFVAEFAQIPTSELVTGDSKVAKAKKLAEGVRISREMIRSNSVEKLNAQVIALQNNIIKGSAQQFISALDNADTNTIAASTPWTAQGSTPIRDIFSGKALISGANVNGSKFGYSAKALVISQAGLDSLLVNEDVQRFYVGNAATQNPIYAGTQPANLNGMSIHVSSFIDDGTAYIIDTDRAGFYKDFEPFTVTDLYAEYGENGFGGSNQSLRIDAFRSRIVVVNAPKAITKITGISEG